MAHRCVEWDGWEEGLFDSILGSGEQEEEWFTEHDSDDDEKEECQDDNGGIVNGDPAGMGVGNGYSFSKVSPEGQGSVKELLPPVPLKPRPRLPFATEKEKVKMLDTTGDVCGGRGGELGRRLEAWLHVRGNSPDPALWGNGTEQDADAVGQVG